MPDKQALSGNEAVGLGALHAGLSSAYAYPGTPSTEILQYLINQKSAQIQARWSANEKTALEEAMGVSFCGRRALVCMKHVGLNVAADPFMSAALVAIKGGLVIAVADDPGMHSSQSEQDSRFYADFAMIPCLEPSGQQEAYDMTQKAFDLSEELGMPVMLRLVTRLSHSRALVQTGASGAVNPLEKSKGGWVLVPSLARRRYADHLEKQTRLAQLSEDSAYNTLTLSNTPQTPGVITTGLAQNYFRENADRPDVNHLHIGQYPWPVSQIRSLMKASTRVLVLEDGMPLLERFLLGTGNPEVPVDGRLNGALPRQGELDPENVRAALGLDPLPRLEFNPGGLPPRPPQLCKGCPHFDSFSFIKKITAKLERFVVMSDIGCYSLGIMPPLEVPETVVCMGASVSMAKGAGEAGHPNVMAVIGDSTFLHSGMTGLADCVEDQTNVTVIILDNGTVAMTGGQKTIAPSARLPQIAAGLGVEQDHIRVVDAFLRDHDKNAAILKEELEFDGPSVIIAVRECVEMVKKRLAAKKNAGAKQ